MTPAEKHAAACRALAEIYHAIGYLADAEQCANDVKNPHRTVAYFEEALRNLNLAEGWLRDAER